MANTKSAIKAARKTVRLTARNQNIKTRLKTLHKKFEQAAKKGIIHKNAASHAKSHVSKFVLAKA